MSQTSGPFVRSNRHLRPFVAVTVLAWAIVPVGSAMHWGTYALAGGLAVLAGMWCIAPLPGALAKAREAIPGLIFMVAVWLGSILLTSLAARRNQLWNLTRLVPVVKM